MDSVRTTIIIRRVNRNYFVDLNYSNIIKASQFVDIVNIKEILAKTKKGVVWQN